MKKLLKYLKPYLVAVTLAPLFMLGEVIIDIIQPSLMASIVDVGIKNGDISYVAFTGLKMLGLTVLGVIGGFGCVYFSSIASQYFGADLRQEMYKKIQTFSFADLDKFKSASLVTRLTNDITQVQQLVLMGLRMMVRAPLLCIGGFIMAMRLNLKLSLTLAVALPLLVLSLVFVLRKAFPLFSIVQKKLDRVNTIMQENLSGVRVVKAFVRSTFEKQRFGGANEDLAEISIKANRIIAIAMPILTLVMNFTVVAVLWYGGFLANSGEIEVGKIIAFINYTTQILFSIMMLTMMLVFVSRAEASAVRISEVLETESDIQSPNEVVKNGISNGVVEFKNVTFKYNEGEAEPELTGINLTIKQGETVAILGETGAGKTTLVNLIPRLYDVTDGAVLIDGVDVRKFDLEALRGEISVVLHDTILFSGTIAENIRWGKEDATDDEIAEAAEIAQASEFIDVMPNKYETVVGQRGVGLSGGQKQRVAIARAIIRKPKILILDDSTSAVDVMTEAQIQKYFREKLRDTTCIIIAQRISTALDADRILVMKEGKIVEEGTHEVLIKKDGIYTEIYKSQLGTEGL